MNQLGRLLEGLSPAAVYRFGSRAEPSTILGAARHEGWLPFYLDGRQIASKTEFLHACAEAMAFPHYFGHNWDALLDSLRDLSWAPADAGYLVLYDHTATFAKASPHDFATALDILHSACSSWRGTNTPLAVLLRGGGKATAHLPEP